MFKVFCDKCGNLCERASTKRYDQLASSTDNHSIGLECIVLFDGGQVEDRHLCDKCFFRMIYDITKEHIPPEPVIITESLNDHKIKVLESVISNANNINIELNNENKKLVDEAKSLQEQVGVLKIDIDRLKRKAKPEEEVTKPYRDIIANMKANQSVEISKVVEEYERRLTNGLIKQESALTEHFTRLLNAAKRPPGSN